MKNSEIDKLDLTEDGKKYDCVVDEDSTPEQISECIARTRRDMDDTLNAVEKKIDTTMQYPSKLYDRSMGYVRQNYQNELQWFSDIPRRINENPESFIIIGTGMVIGGLGIAGYALSKQRKNTPKSYISAKFEEAKKGVVEKGKEKWREMRSHSDVPQKSRTAHLRPAPETFAAVAGYQASTEEISYDQTEFDQDESSHVKSKLDKTFDRRKSYDKKDDRDFFMKDKS